MVISSPCLIDIKNWLVQSKRLLRLADSTLQVPLDEIRVDVKLSFVEEPVEILEREFKKLKRSRIAIVKVRWNSKRRPEFTERLLGSQRNGNRKFLGGFPSGYFLSGRWSESLMDFLGRA
ncbi:hypothetical protein Tco_0077125 [Tanacetum coccineum]